MMRFGRLGNFVIATQLMAAGAAGILGGGGGCGSGAGGNFVARDLAGTAGDRPIATDLATGPADLAMAPVDLAMPPPADLAIPPGPADLSQRTDDLAGTPVPATLHDIAVGVVPDRSLVVVTGAVVTGIPRFIGTTSGGICRYNLYVQDPRGQAPSGMRLYVGGDPCVQSGTTCRCNFPPASNTPFDQVLGLGEAYTITGTVSTYQPSGTPVLQHDLVVRTMVRTGTGTVTPVVLTDGTPLALNSAAYQQYESMLVTIRPPQRFTVTAPNSYGDFTGAGAQFAGLYRFVYAAQLDAGTFPPGGSSWSAITGIAQTAYGGGVAPRQVSDFVP